MIVDQSYTYGLFSIEDDLPPLELICFKFDNKIEETLFYNLCQKYPELIRDINTDGRMTIRDERLKGYLQTLKQSKVRITLRELKNVFEKYS